MSLRNFIVVSEDVATSLSVAIRTDTSQDFKKAIVLQGFRWGFVE